MPWGLASVFALTSGVLIATLGGGAPNLAAASLKGERAVLQGLDKVTARVSEIEAALDEPVRFGTLEIRVRTCHRTPPEEPPESTAFLEIKELRPDESPRVVYEGWMFASTPGLNALEHPVYDVWVLECIALTPEAAGETAGAPQAGE